MHALMLRDNGHNVIILEQAHDTRVSHMAGVCCAADAQVFLARHDPTNATEYPFTLDSERLQFLRHDGHDNADKASWPSLTSWGLGNGHSDNIASYYLKAPRTVTSWDMLYWRLRRGWDGRMSPFYPDGMARNKKTASEDASYRTRIAVLDVGPIEVPHKEHPENHLDSEHAAEAAPIVVRCMDLDTKAEFDLSCDLVVAADGPNSTIRQKYLPNVQRSFSGYVAWRGVVPESKISQESRRVFEKNVTLNLMEEDHALMYVQFDLCRLFLTAPSLKSIFKLHYTRQKWIARAR